MSSAHSPTFPSLYLRHSPFSNRFVALPTSQPILQPFRRFTYVTAHSPTLPSPYLRHSSFSNPSVASTTSQLILQPFFRFSYVTGSSFTSPGEPPMVEVHFLDANPMFGCILVVSHYQLFVYPWHEGRFVVDILLVTSQHATMAYATVLCNKGDAQVFSTLPSFYPKHLTVGLRRFLQL